MNRGCEDSREFHTPGIQVTRRASSPVQKSRSPKDISAESGPRESDSARIDCVSRRGHSGTETRVGTAIYTVVSNFPLRERNLSVAKRVPSRAE